MKSRLPVMPSYHVIGAYRAAISSPTPHVHLVAIGTIDGDDSELVPTKAWTAKDLQDAKRTVSFVIGPADVTVPADVSTAFCPECGELVVRLFPAQLEPTLPECRVG